MIGRTGETGPTEPEPVGPSPDKAKAAAPVRRPLRGSPRLAQYKRTWYFLRRNTLAMVGLGVLVLFLVIALYAAWFQPGLPWGQLNDFCSTNQGNGAPNDCVPGQAQICTYAQGTTAPHAGCYQTPSAYPSVIPPTLTFAHGVGPLPLGSLTVLPTSTLSYSIYQGLLRGIDWTLIISVSIVAGGALAGLFLGAISGYFGGVVDEVIMRIVDIFLSIPQVLFVIIVVAVFSSTSHSIAGLDATATDVLLVIVGFMAVWWPFYTRLVRGQVLVTREQKYVEAARASGASRGRIISRHIVPNSVYPVFIQMSLDVGTVPLFLAALAFLGFKFFPTQYFPEVGVIAALSVTNLQGFLDGCQVGICYIPWWQILIPGLTLFAYAISVNFLADGLRDALDPRLRR
ncbi:MAG TPA: ABC transporter permease [Thermoplasmata archaeon]|nr:ABC transporter permease [Thermoplasmata archaeon]